MGDAFLRSDCRSPHREHPGSPAGASATEPDSLVGLGIAYLCGSIPSGLWLARGAGVDIRARGSGNIGATNVARSLGRRLGVLTLVLDATKAIVPLFVAGLLGAATALLASMAVAVVVGHVFSAFASFRGGKGVATAAGAFLYLAPLSLLASFVAFVATFALARFVSLASLCAVLGLPLFATVLGEEAATRNAAIAVAVLVLWKHRENIHRLRAGTEPRFRAEP